MVRKSSCFVRDKNLAGLPQLCVGELSAAHAMVSGSMVSMLVARLGSSVELSIVAMRIDCRVVYRVSLEETKQRRGKSVQINASLDTASRYHPRKVYKNLRPASRNN